MNVKRISLNPVVVRTCVDSLVTGEVALVAERRLAAVTLVWLVAVNWDNMICQRFIFSKRTVAFIAEERLCKRNHNKSQPPLLRSPLASNLPQ